MTDEKVVLIFKSKEKYITLAKKYGVDPSIVSNIKKRKNWTHVTEGLKNE